MEETPDINMPSFDAFEYGCAVLFSLVAHFTVRIDTKKHVLLSNRHHQDHLSLNYLRMKTLVVMIWEWLMGKLKDSVNLDGVCLLYYKL